MKSLLLIVFLFSFGAHAAVKIKNKTATPIAGSQLYNLEDGLTVPMIKVAELLAHEVVPGVTYIQHTTLNVSLKELADRGEQSLSPSDVKKIQTFAKSNVADVFQVTGNPYSGKYFLFISAKKSLALSVSL